MDRSGIYRIVCLPTGKSYVGSSKHVGLRWRQHYRELSRGASRCVLLQRAWTKHGEDSFQWSVLEYCDLDVLFAREEHYIRTQKPEFNVAVCVPASMMNRKHSEESRAKMVKSHKNHPRLESSARLRLSEKLRGNRNALGSVRSPETLAKMAAAATGKTHVVSDEARAIMSASQIGNKKGVGRVVSEEIKKRMSVLMTGRVFSAETLAKMSASQKQRHARERQVSV